MSANTRNGSEAKFYPKTHITIERALMAAKFMNDNLVFAGVLTTKTSDRLNAIEPLFKQQMTLLGQRKTERAILISKKDEARMDTAMFASHFLQVFNMGAKRGKYAVTDRGLFGMTLSRNALPSFKGDDNIDMAAKQVIDGEALRIAAGKPAVTNPSADEVEEKYNQFIQFGLLASNANEALMMVQSDLRKLAKEGRAVVKKVWREVETYYSEGRRERMRKKGREWGIIYARKGHEKKVRGIITDAATGLPLGAVKLKFANGNNKVLTGADGRFTLITNLMHEQNLLATRSGYDPAEIIIELREGEESFCEVKMVRVV